MKQFEDDNKAVAWKYRTNPYTNQWFATTSKEIAVMYDEVEPLYSHADPAYIEQGYHPSVVQALLSTNDELREDCAILRTQLAEANQLVEKLKKDVTEDALRHSDICERLAETQALLRDLVNECMASDFNEHWHSFKVAEAYLSASAERKENS